MNKKEKLKRIKASVLALSMIGSFALSGCSKEEPAPTSDKRVAVSFISGKAIIYEEGTDIGLYYDSGNIGISNSMLMYNYEVYLAQVPTVVVRSYENAYEFASKIVGEENILEVDLQKNEDNEFTLKLNK